MAPQDQLAVEILFGSCCAWSQETAGCCGLMPILLSHQRGLGNVAATLRTHQLNHAVMGEGRVRIAEASDFCQQGVQQNVRRIRSTGLTRLTIGIISSSGHSKSNVKVGI